MAIEQRADVIIRNCREQTGNAAYSSTQGVRQREMVRYLNDAQTRIYNRMTCEHSTLFTKYAYMDVVAGVANYALPTDIFLQNNILTVHYSHNGNPINYAPLEMRSPRQEISVRGYPGFYFLRDGYICLNPIPSSTVANAMRMYYQYTIPDLDIRRGRIQTIAGTSPITAITLIDGSIIDESADDLANGWADYISLVDQDGNICAKGMLVDSYDISTRTINLEYTPTTSDTIDSAVWVVFGKNATTHSVLPPICSRYLTDYTALRVQMRDSNREAVDTSPILAAIEQEILDAIGDLSEDITAVPVLDYSMISYVDEL